MTKKDYILIAAVIANSTTFEDDDDRQRFASEMADALETTNPLFSRDTFTSAAS